MGFWNGRIWELLDCRYNGKTTKCEGHRSWKVWAPAHNYCVSNPLTSSGLSFFLSKMGVIMWIHASASWGTEKVHLKTLKARVCVWGGGGALWCRQTWPVGDSVLKLTFYHLGDLTGSAMLHTQVKGNPESTHHAVPDSVTWLPGTPGIIDVQSLSHVWLFAIPWTAACQASYALLCPGVCSNSCPLSWRYHPTISSCLPLLLLPSHFPSIGSFPELEKYQRFSVGNSHISMWKVNLTHLGDSENIARKCR